MLTILIPVGPNPIYLQYLPEAIESVLNQTVLPNEILIVCDGTGIDTEGILLKAGVNNISPMWVDSNEIYTRELDNGIRVRTWDTPWNIGFSQAFNCGVGLAKNDLILYLAADDTLAPTAVEDCLNTWNENNQKDAWYALTYKSSPSGNEATIPINAAMITKNLWKWLKGYPPAAFAGPDALLLSILMVHASDRIIKVAEGKFNYFIREHPDQETRRQMSFYAASGVVEIIRNMETQRFVPDAGVVLK